jgi:hypothetical protein
MIDPIPIPLELTLLKDRTSTQRGSDGTVQMHLLTTDHEAVVKQQVLDQLGIALASVQATIKAQVSPTYNDGRLVIIELTKLDALCAPPPRAQVQTWAQMDAALWELEATRAQVGHLWNTATLCSAVYDQAIAPFKLFIRLSSAADKEADKEDEIRRYCAELLAARDDFETAREFGRRLYERVSALIDSIHRLSQRQFASGQYAQGTDSSRHETARV